MVFDEVGSTDEEVFFFFATFRVTRDTLDRKHKSVLIFDDLAKRLVKLDFKHALSEIRSRLQDLQSSK